MERETAHQDAGPSQASLEKSDSGIPWVASSQEGSPGQTLSLSHATSKGQH